MTNVLCAANQRYSMGALLNPTVGVWAGYVRGIKVYDNWQLERVARQPRGRWGQVPVGSTSASALVTRIFPEKMAR